jgi:hypothetical protein
VSLRSVGCGGSNDSKADQSGSFEGYAPSWTTGPIPGLNGLPTTFRGAHETAPPCTAPLPPAPPAATAVAVPECSGIAAALQRHCSCTAVDSGNAASSFCTTRTSLDVDSYEKHVPATMRKSLTSRRWSHVGCPSDPAHAHRALLCPSCPLHPSCLNCRTFVLHKEAARSREVLLYHASPDCVPRPCLERETEILPSRRRKESYRPLSCDPQAIVPAVARHPLPDATEMQALHQMRFRAQGVSRHLPGSANRRMRFLRKEGLARRASPEFTSVGVGEATARQQHALIPTRRISSVERGNGGGPATTNPCRSEAAVCGSAMSRRGTGILRGFREAVWP